jgi:hypothetical protein
MRTHLRSTVFIAVCLSFSVAVSAAPASDYLTSDLRARVEKLKADLAAEPGNETNLEERARVLWAWANAYALDGGYLPVNLTQGVAAVFAYRDTVRQRPTLLDDFIREMTLRDEEPEAIGSLSADLGPFEARSFVTLRQTYTVGSRPVTAGGGLVVARHFMPNYGHWQTADPEADNFISITSSRSGVTFTATTAAIAGMHGAFRGVGEALMFKVAEGTLLPDDQVIITYGNTSSGSRGFLMADFSSDRMPLPLYLVLEEDGLLLSLPIQPIQVTGTAFAGLHGFAPSVVATGETFAISLRAEDHYRNRALAGHPELQLLLDGEVIAIAPPSSEAISIVDELQLDKPGVYRFSVATSDGSVTGSVNPVLVTDSPQRRIYWGDTHGHSGFAEGIGTADRFMRWARDDARLDYVTHSEHDIWMDDQEWVVLRDNVRRYTQEGQFIAFLGYEWTVRNFQGGHHNVLFRTPDRRNRVPVQFYPTLSQLYQGLRADNNSADVLIIPHAHQAGDYRQNDPELEPLVEIMSQHGNFEWFASSYLEHGHQIGFTAASDNHLSQPGYTAPKNTSLAQRGGLGAVLAASRTTDSLFDALKERHTYATTGERMIVDVTVNGTTMGQRAAHAEVRSISGRVIGTAPIDQITIMKNNQPIWQQDYLQATEERLQSAELLLLSFASDATPYHPGDNPRGWRHWRGTIELSGAQLGRVDAQDFHNLSVQSLRIDNDNPNLLHFTTLTRGDSSSILLQLDGAKRSSTLTISLEAARETGSGPPVYRKHQELDAASVTFEFKDLEVGRSRQTLASPGYEDTITLRRVISDGPMDVSFDLEDTGQKQGDYYYVRIRQVDDAMAWTSPIWVGGFPSQ